MDSLCNILYKVNKINDYFILMKTHYIVFVLFFITFSFSGICSEDFSSSETISGMEVLIRSQNEKVLDLLRLPGKKIQLESFLLHFRGVLQEVENKRIGGEKLELTFGDDPSKVWNSVTVLILTESPQKYFVKNIFYGESLIQNQPRILGFDMEKEIPEIKALSIYHVRNMAFDPKENLLKRIVLHGERYLFPDYMKNEERFLEGKMIEYRDYRVKGCPQGFIYKTFILTNRGALLVTAEKASEGRMYHDNGNLAQETVRETQYSYQNFPSRNTFYNVEFNEAGAIKSFDLFPASNPENPVSASANGECTRVELYDFIGTVPLNELRLYYTFSEGKKEYHTGRWIETHLRKDFMIISTRHTEFNIVQGKKGRNPKERDLTSRVYIFNREYNFRDMPVTKRIIKSVFKDNQEILESLRDIYFEYDFNQAIEKVAVEFLKPDAEGNLIPLRHVALDVLEYHPSQEPKKVKLKIGSGNKEDAFEQTIYQDCTYMMDEMIYGSVFIPPLSDAPASFIIKKMEEDGNLEIETSALSVMKT